nr:hypothetical protein [Candidatus Sigynarchaeota archaeon]
MFSYYRRRRTYTRNPFSCSITSCITAIIGLVGGIIFLLYSTGALTAEQMIQFVIIVAVVGVIIIVLYLVLRYYKPKKSTSSSSKSSSSSRTRSTSSSRSRTSSRARNEEEDESDDRRYAKAPARAETASSKFTPREDVTEDAPKKTTTTKKKKASFFDNVDSSSGETSASTDEATVPAATKTCAKCGKQSPVEAKFCIDCGTSF